MAQSNEGPGLDKIEMSIRPDLTYTKAEESLQQELQPPPLPRCPGEGDAPRDLEQQKENHKKGDPKQQNVNKFLSTTAKLGYFLPTGTSLLFETAVPKIYRSEQCSYIGKIMMWLLLGLCVAICFFSQFAHSKTETYNAKDHSKKKVVYEIIKWSDLETSDWVHAVTSVIAFLTIAFADQRVVDCVLPAHVKEFEEVMLGLDVMVLSVCSFLYLAFPSKRSGLVPKLAYDDKVK